MGELATQSPLMLSVLWQGHEYFTSQYFHAQYLANSQYGGKYARHDEFLRVVRGIEAYALYIQQGDIVELTWAQVKSSSTQILRSALAPLFEARGYQKLYLLNATAQVALSHHLDDELSQQLSVATNTSAARQMTRKASGPLLPEEHASRALAAFMDIGRQLQTPPHIAQQEAVKQIAATTGVNLQPFLLGAPAQDAIPPDAKRLEPTDLAAALGWGPSKGAALNKALEALGWQVRAIGGGWEATPAGTPYCSAHAWTSERGTKSGYNLKWSLKAVQDALQDMSDTQGDVKS